VPAIRAVPSEAADGLWYMSSGMDVSKNRLIRSATLTGYPEAARDVGLDPEAMLNGVGLQMRCMDDPDTPIPLDAFLQLLADSAAQSGCTDFGMRAAIRRGTPDLGSVSLLMREAETVEAALGYYTSHLTLHADGTVIQLDTRFRQPLVIVEIAARTREQSFQATQFAVTGVTMQIRWLIGEDSSLSWCRSRSRRRPVRRDAQRFFKCPLAYNQVVSGVVLGRDVLAHPLVTSPPFLRKLALQQLDPLLTRPAQSFATKVDRVVRRLMESGAFDSRTVATHFGIDRRTLNRRLEREGETFSSVLQRVRVEAARRALEGCACSLTEVADATGFESLSSFSRWFQKSFGCTATQWRSQQTVRSRPVLASRPRSEAPGRSGHASW